MNIFAALNLALLLCMAPGSSGAAAMVQPHGIRESGHTTDGQFSSVSTSDLFLNVTHNENSVSNTGISGSVKIRELFSHFSAMLISSARLDAHLFLQYQFYARYLLARIQKTDIIFPYHYFW